jgi:hypothetical protein
MRYRLPQGPRSAQRVDPRWAIVLPASVGYFESYRGGQRVNQNTVNLGTVCEECGRWQPQKVMEL